jgi:hypothetical protein
MASSRSATRRHRKFRGTILLSRAYFTFDADIEGNVRSPMALVALNFCFAGSMRCVPGILLLRLFSLSVLLKFVVKLRRRVLARDRCFTLLRSPGLTPWG